MKKTIKYGERVALLNSSDHRAMLKLEDAQLPTRLADEINRKGDIRVNEVAAYGEGLSLIRIAHDLPNSELINAVCESIAEVYGTNTTVCYAPA